MFKDLFNSRTVTLQLLLTSLVVNALGLTGAIFAMVIFRRYLSHGIDTTLITVTTGAVLAITLDFVLRRVRFRTIATLSARLWRKVGDSVFEKMLSGDPEVLMHRGNTANKNILERLLGNFSAGVTPSVIISLLDLPFAILFLGVLLLLAWQLAAVALIAILIVVALTWLRKSRYSQFSEDLQDANSAQTAVLNTVERFEVVQLNNAGEFLRGRWQKAAGEARVRKFYFEDLLDKTSSSSLTITLLTTITIIAVGSKLVLSGDLDIASLIAGNILGVRAVSSFIRPLHSLSAIVRAQTAYRRIEALLGLPEKNRGQTELVDYKGRLELEDVSFGFPQGKGPLFEHLNAHIEPGSILVVKGRNGSGKTTLARLLCGFYRPRRGSISVAGNDMQQIDANFWRTQLIYVPQDPELLTATLRNYFRFLAPDISDSKIYDLLGKVGLDNFARGTAEGLDLTLREHGGNLTPGIKRKLAIARALATDGPLVILDEPMTSLDDEGIAAVQKIVAALHETGKTIILFSSSELVPAFATHVIDLNDKPTPKMVMADA